MKKSTRKPAKKKAVVRPKRPSFDERLESLARRSESEFDKIVELRKSLTVVQKAAEAAAKAAAKQAETAAKQAEAAVEAAAKQAETAAKQAEAAVEAATKQAEAAVADRDRLAKLENAVDNSRKKNENHTHRLARMLENAFADSLPRVMKAEHGVILKPKDIRIRVRKNNHSAEFDFVAPNGDLALAGEVKTHLTLDNVDSFLRKMTVDFREMFPEYAHMPVYGVVAGGEIDEDAAHYARKLGFYILRLEGAELHPATGQKYRAKAY